MIHTIEAFLLPPESGHPNGILDPTGKQDGHFARPGENGSSRHPNPFRAPLLPIPCDPYEDAWHEDLASGQQPWLDHNLFSEDAVSRVLQRNEGWLQDSPRSTADIREILFPTYEPSGMKRGEIFAVINNALFDLGYQPSHEGTNPTWTFPANA